MGCLWACHFRALGHEVTLLSRHCIDRESISIAYQPSYNTTENVSSPASYRVNTASSKTYSSIASPAGNIENLFITTKSQDALDALQSVGHLLNLNSQVITLCNGMGYHQSIADYLATLPGNITLLAGVCSDGALLETSSNTYSLSHTGKGITYIGHFPDKAGPPISSFPLQTKPRNGLLNIKPCSAIEVRIMQKFFINCAINPLTTIYQCHNGELLTNPDAKETFTKLCHELQRIYDATLPNRKRKKMQIPKEAGAFDVLQVASSVAENTSNNYSSMLRDYQQGRPLELKHLNAYLLELATESKLESPLSNDIHEQLVDLTASKITS